MIKTAITYIQKNIKEKKEMITIIEKTYLFSYFTAFVTAVLWYQFGGERWIAFITIFSLFSFTFSILNDAIENGKNLFNYPAYKLLGSVIISIIITLVLIKTYQDVNSITGVDPTLLSFTTSLVFIFNMISYSTFIIGLTFMILLMVLTGFLPLIISWLTSKEKEKKEKNPWKVFSWLSRFIALFCIYVLGNMFSPNGLIMNKVAPSLMTDLAIYADFNSKHNCLNKDLIDKPVLFLQKGFVLIHENKEFIIKECY